MKSITVTNETFKFLAEHGQLIREVWCIEVAFTCQHCLNVHGMGTHADLYTNKYPFQNKHKTPKTTTIIHRLAQL